MGNYNSKEIEIQVQIETGKDLLSFLKTKAKFVGEEHQIDKYFTPSHRDFRKTKPVKEWLRLRDASGHFSITYKNVHYEKDGRVHDKDEYETEIADIYEVEKIFSALEMKQIVMVDKTRKIYRYKDFEISLDSVKNLGDFVEVEFKGDLGKNTPIDITNNMVDFLKKLNCGKIIRNYTGYPYMLLFPDETNFEVYN